MVSMHFSVVVLNYNNWKDTVACIESILCSDDTPESIVIIDNNSNDDSVARIQEWAVAAREKRWPVERDGRMFPLETLTEKGMLSAGPLQKLILVCCDKNGGYAAGNNVGIRLALRSGAQAVWVLNNDTLVESAAAGAMYRRLFSSSRPGLCGSLVRYMDGDKLVQCRGGGRFCKWTGLSVLDGHLLPVSEALAESTAAVEERINFIYGASVMASRQFLETVGLMDERYFLYCEEQDWAYGAKGRFDFCYASDAVVWHKEGASSGHCRKNFNPRRLWYLLRSRLLLQWKWPPITLPVVSLCCIFAGVRLVLRRLTWENIRYMLGKSRSNS